MPQPSCDGGIDLWAHAARLASRFKVPVSVERVSADLPAIQWMVRIGGRTVGPLTTRDTLLALDILNAGFAASRRD